MKKKVTIAASELHRAAGKALKRVTVQDELLIVERDGYPVAVLMSYHEYQKLIRLRAMSVHQELVRDLSQEAEKQSLSEEQLLVELEKDKQAVYKATYGSDAS